MILFKNNRKIALFLLVWLDLFHTFTALNCYQCSGSDPNRPFQCNEFLSSDIDIQPESCDGVFEAKYCVKHTGRFEGFGIKCFQCAASDTIDCSDGMISSGGLEPQSCDHVFEAEYCIKSTGLDRGIGAKRFCSSLDLGNYCNYVRQPGDLLTYRTCLHTCTGDGCNSSGKIQPIAIIIVLLAALLQFVHLI